MAVLQSFDAIGARSAWVLRMIGRAPRTCAINLLVEHSAASPEMYTGPIVAEGRGFMDNPRVIQPEGDQKPACSVSVTSSAQSSRTVPGNDM